jgi:hypothetical protein
LGLEEVDLKDKAHPDNDDAIRWKWKFCIVSGQHKGKEISALTARKLNPLTEAGRIIAGLVGRKLETGVNVKAEIAAAVGQRRLVRFGPGIKGGKSAVRDVSAVPEM